MATTRTSILQCGRSSVRPTHLPARRRKSRFCAIESSLACRCGTKRIASIIRTSSVRFARANRRAKISVNDKGPRAIVGLLVSCEHRAASRLLLLVRFGERLPLGGGLIGGGLSFG